MFKWPVQSSNIPSEKGLNCIVSQHQSIGPIRSRSNRPVCTQFSGHHLPAQWKDGRDALHLHRGVACSAASSIDVQEAVDPSIPAEKELPGNVKEGNHL